MSIRKRLTLWYATLLTVIIVLLGLVIYGVMRWVLVDGIDRSLAETAEYINTNSRFFPLAHFDGAAHAYGIDLSPLDAFTASGKEVQVWLLNRDASYSAVETTENLKNYDRPLDVHGLGVTEPTYHTVSINASVWRVRASPIWSGDKLLGNIQVAQSLQTVNHASNALLFIVGLTSLLAILGSAVMSMLLARHIVAPVEEITQAAAYVAGTKDLSTRLEWKGAMDEVGILSTVFNQMMERLENLFSVQQRFVADISHELRTPLTAIRGNVDMMKRYGMDEESLTAIDSEASRMARLVNDFLMLARADYGGIQIERYPLDLDTVVMEVFQTQKAQATKKNIQLRVSRLEPLRVQGNADRMKQVLLNLTDNALKFTPEGGSVLLSLERRENCAVLAVQDTGKGIEPEHLTRIFDRFYQTDSSRSQNSEGGFGLGLAIAKWLVEAHGGTIAVESVVGQGTTFTVRIPLDGEQLLDEEEDHSKITKTRVAIKRRVPQKEP